MKKESKNTGISKSCPECKKFLFKGLKFVGDSSEESLKCPHCGAQLYRIISTKVIIKITKIVVLVIGIVIGSALSYNVIQAWHVNCGSFLNREAAQSVLKYYPRLDKNHDGVACQDYKYKK